jgi:NAD(P)-dependent dehydrogenase (short-subunit alcohol dehydrogenase family)
MNIQDKVAVVTGTRRIGGEVSFALAEKGADVALVYNRSEEEAKAAAEKIRALGRRALAVRADLGVASEVRSLFDQVDSSLGGVDILVNVASTYRTVPFEKVSEDSWDADIDSNLKSAFLCGLSAAPIMKRRGGGRIINFSDWIAASGRPRYRGYLSYYVSKAGVIALTEALALELAPHILVNAIAPGPILPPPELTAEENREVVEATPLGSWGGANEIAKTVVHLVESDFITGECLRVDGGRHIR